MCLFALRICNRRVKVCNLETKCVCMRFTSQWVIFFLLFFLIIDVEFICPIEYLCVSEFSFISVFSLCVLCEEACVGCSFISRGSNCVKCSSGGAVCPAADAAWTWPLGAVA